MRVGGTITRRGMLAGSGAALAATGVSLAPRRARAQRKTLRIMQWRHFVPAYDPWFNETFAREWGETNDVDVIVDNVGFADLTPRAAAEIQAQRGHDLIQFVTPHAMLADHLIDHREIFEECSRRYGKPTEFALRAHFNPKTKTYSGFAAAYQPALITYRSDLWAKAQAVPNTWDDVLTGARRIKLLDGKPAVFSLAPEHNCEQTLRSIMYSFGASEQDADGRPTLKSQATLDTLRYVKNLFEQAMIPDVLGWDGASNNRFMLTGEGCLTVDSLSIPRAAESMKLDFAGDLRLAAMPAGPASRLGSFGFYTYSIWKFAENPEGAKQFLIDYVGQSNAAFLASGFQNMPCYPATVPDLEGLTGAAGNGIAAKYGLMKDVASWTTNVGHPGYTNPAVSEIYARGIVSKMFADVATGRLTPEQALDGADREERAIFDSWRERGHL
jgi:multiple sugar transport system substrate-binding protein